MTLDPAEAPPGYEAKEVPLRHGCTGCAFRDGKFYSGCAQTVKVDCRHPFRQDRTHVIFVKKEPTP